MSRQFRLYNLNFLKAEDFQPFTVDGYTFYPVPERQPRKQVVYTPEHALRFNRRVHLNARVSIPARQKDSILRKGGKDLNNRKIKFLEDLLVIISICIGRNVVPKFCEKRLEFPLCSAKHCEMVSKNSTELRTHLESAISEIRKDEWQQKYDNGFHVRAFYNASDIFVAEPRFLADITIWEYLYYCSNRSMSYYALTNVSLNTKLNYLVRKYLMDNVRSIPEERLRIFKDIRHQLSHSGKLPIENPQSPFQHLGWSGFREYLKLFRHLTQVLVLKTIGIDALDQLKDFDVRPHLEELLRSRSVSLYETPDRLEM
jgi:hypothetical protein